MQRGRNAYVNPSWARFVHNRPGTMLRILALLVVLTSVALGKPVPVGVLRMRPSQIAIGKAGAYKYMTTWTADAKARHLTLGEYARLVLQPEFDKKEITGSIAPDGRVLNDDAHHRVAALLMLYKRTGVEVSIPVEIEADHTGKTNEQFARDWIGKQRKGYFGLGTGHLSVEEKLALLPKSYDKLGNDTLRAAVGEAFDTMDLSGKMFHDYVEFKAGKKLLSAGLMKRLRDKEILPKHARSIPVRRALDPAIVGEVRDMLHEPDAKKLLLSHVSKKKYADQVRERLAN